MHKSIVQEKKCAHNWYKLSNVVETPPNNFPISQVQSINSTIAPNLSGVVLTRTLSLTETVPKIAEIHQTDADRLVFVPA